MDECCMIVIFFFKQKTAYEMRISDWSSDVCSSDLPCGFRSPNQEIPRVAGLVIGRHRCSPAPVIIFSPSESCTASRKSSKAWRLTSPYRNIEEIGRASCRERVCQYV